MTEIYIYIYIGGLLDDWDEMWHYDGDQLHANWSVSGKRVSHIAIRCIETGRASRLSQRQHVRMSWKWSSYSA